MSKKHSPAVFLDRDGVVNEPLVIDGVARAPASVDAVKIPEDVPDALIRLKAAGFILVVVSNQPDVARGLFTSQDVEAVHDRLAETLPIDAFYWCPHDNDAGCDCRKPLPGLILRSSEDLGLDLERSCLVGDRWVDIAAAHNAGIDGLLVRRPYSWEPTSAGPPPPDLVPDFESPTFGLCAAHILGTYA